VGGVNSNYSGIRVVNWIVFDPGVTHFSHHMKMYSVPS
jgi:hypothetical protein